MVEKSVALTTSGYVSFFGSIMCSKHWVLVALFKISYLDMYCSDF